jgi:hypothetical protein
MPDPISAAQRRSQLWPPEGVFSGGYRECVRATFYKQSKGSADPEPFEVARDACRQELADQQAEKPKTKKRAKKEVK